MKIEDFLEVKQPIDRNSENFNSLMYLYSLAVKEMERKINIIKYDYTYLYDYDFIDHVKTRIKTPESIIKKMQEKGYELTYQNLIEKVQDIAGIRIITPLKNDVFQVNELIKEFPEIKIIQEKDYVTMPKESGYSSYHLIAEVPVYLKDEIIYVKTEIQIRSLAMDFWASLEHKIKYKPNGEINEAVSKELVECAMDISSLDNKMVTLFHH